MTLINTDRGGCMLSFDSIKLEDKIYFDKILKKKEYEACEYCFTNFYIWKESFDLECSISENVIFVRGKLKDKRFYFMPIAEEGYMDEALETLIRMEGNSLLIKCGNDVILKEVGKETLDKFRIDDDFEINDYFYNASDLINLKGKKYHQKRNHINKFKSLYEYEFVPITEKDAEKCLELNELWKNSKEENSIHMQSETIAMRNAMENLSYLGLTGAMIIIDGDIKAFTVGEVVHKNLGIVHFEKADISYNGIYPAINQMFAEYAFSDVNFINRQDDMGLPGLRKSKKSYHPVKMINKYMLRYK